MPCRDCVNWYPRQIGRRRKRKCKILQDKITSMRIRTEADHVPWRLAETFPGESCNEHREK